MSSFLVVLAVTAICITWVRASRRNRQRWLARLDLPGRWQWQDHAGTLELEGELGQGRYRFEESAFDGSGNEEQGRWWLRSHDLVLQPDGEGDVTALDLRLFEEGKIGIHGPGRERRIYVKQRANVVPLRRPA